MPNFCSVEGCKEESCIKGMCRGHYKAMWRKAHPYGINPKPCNITGCENFAHAKGMCKAHYLRWRKRGSTDLKINICGLAKKYPKEHAVWASMKARCNNPKNPEYRHYGGRGIKVCDRWLGVYGFQNFLQDMGLRPKGRHGKKPKYTIDRIDVNGDYTPSNCAWRDWYDQATNRRSSLSIPGVRKLGEQWEARITVLGKEYHEYGKTKQEAMRLRKSLEHKYRR